MCKRKDKQGLLQNIRFVLLSLPFLECMQLFQFFGTHQQLFPSSTSIIEHNTSDKDIYRNKLS